MQHVDRRVVAARGQLAGQRAVELLGGLELGEGICAVGLQQSARAAAAARYLAGARVALGRELELERGELVLELALLGALVVEARALLGRG